MLIKPEEARGIIRRGGIVALPTDTVYGLAVDPFSEAAVAALDALKGQRENKPFLLLGGSLSQLLPFCALQPPGFQELTARFWPGCLTLVVPASRDVPVLVTRGRTTVGLRVPDCRAARELALQCGPLAVPSANPSGEPPALTAREVEAYFGPSFPVLEGRCSAKGLVSTILGWERDSWVVIRSGALSCALLFSKLAQERQTIS
jgi:L-threonylcarbamoyladenylate synthase